MKTMFAAGRWPGEYERGREGPRFVNDEGEELCAWCHRPISTCVTDPCEHYRGPVELDDEAVERARQSHADVAALFHEEGS